MKKVLLIILLFIPFFVSARECDSSLHKEYATFASKISYDNDFTLARGSFNVTFYNVVDGLYFVYNGKNYYPIDNEIQITSVEQGTKMSVYVRGNDGCDDAVRIISINEPYYNGYYGSSLCEGYEDKLSYCSSQFITLPVTRELFDMAKKNIDNGIKQEVEKEVVKEKTIFDRIIEFASSWGVKIALFAITSIGTFSYYNDKFRKIKHGI